MEKNNYKKVKQVLSIILLANLLVAALKIIIGSIIKSTSMTADGFSFLVRRGLQHRWPHRYPFCLSA